MKHREDLSSSFLLPLPASPPPAWGLENDYKPPFDGRVPVFDLPPTGGQSEACIPSVASGARPHLARGWGGGAKEFSESLAEKSLRC